MGDPTASLPSSFRPWETRTPAKKTFTHILSRISAERGHFRDLTEASLLEELAASTAITTNGADDPASPSSSSSSPSLSSTTSRPSSPRRRNDARSRTEQLQEARRDVLNHVATAQNETLLALDFVSLLLSKDVKQAEGTMSPMLKQSVPTGSLGMDMCEGMDEDAFKERTDGLLARGKRVEGLKGAAEGLARAEERLRGTVERERRYWDEVLRVREQGWSLCRVPREKGTLGVRYGFNEAMGEFRGRGLAALRMGKEGAVVLDRGLGRETRMLRVVVVKKGVGVVGSSRAKASHEQLATTSGQIKAARDSLFEEELWHEAMREARELAEYGVKMKGNTIILPKVYTDLTPERAEPQETLEIDLVGADEDCNGDHISALADGVATALRLLLSHTHRQRLEQRSQSPAPLSAEKKERAPAQIIRPLLAHLHHRSGVTQLQSNLRSLSGLLAKAGLSMTWDTTSQLPAALAGIETSSSLATTLSARPSSRTIIKLALYPPTEDPMSWTVDGGTAFGKPFYGTSFVFQDPVRGEAETRSNSVREITQALCEALAGALTVGLGRHFEGWVVDELECKVIRPQVLEAQQSGPEEVGVELEWDQDGTPFLLLRADEVVKWRDDGSERRSWEEVVRDLVTKIRTQSG